MDKISKTDHFYLIDGSGYIFRAYYALPPLTRKRDGLPNYTDLKKEGLDHDPIFHVEVKLQNGLTSIGKAKSKRKAQQNAAKQLLSQVKNSNDR